MEFHPTDEQSVKRYILDKVEGCSATKLDPEATLPYDTHKIPITELLKTLNHIKHRWQWYAEARQLDEQCGTSLGEYT